ncbi:MAG: Gfo/Idh/MocA family oxidoreductase [Clostridia bacterium]|nr:Gfo/Idh/MocA family oxidoreductase [Clostridia bacterium]
MKTLNAAVVGFGFMGRTHTYAYRTIPLYYRDLPYRINLRAVCSGTYSNAQRAADELGFEYALRTADEVFADDSIDIVNICTPNHLHYDQLKKAIDKGKHIYCDKPLAANAAQAAEIAALAMKKGITAQVAFNYRFLPATIRARQLIEEGRIGKPICFRAAYLHSGSVDPKKPAGWKLMKEFGGGVIADLGSHVVDLIYHLLGEYSEVSADSTILYFERPGKSGEIIRIEAEDAFVMMARMKNGCKGTIEASKIATGMDDELRFEIHGDAGAVRFNLMQPNYLEYFSTGDADTPYGGDSGFKRIACVQRYESPAGSLPSPKNSIGWLRGHVHSLYKFTECVNSGIQAAPSFQEGAYVQTVLEATGSSASSGKWTAV